jgi:hypothetical protein
MAQKVMQSEPHAVKHAGFAQPMQMVNMPGRSNESFTKQLQDASIPTRVACAPVAAMQPPLHPHKNIFSGTQQKREFPW